jgi:hypothetical protein
VLLGFTAILAPTSCRLSPLIETGIISTIFIEKVLGVNGGHKASTPNITSKYHFVGTR